MLFYAFSLLPHEKQAEEVWQGEFFLSRETIEHTILLYKVHAFYVEVYYNKTTNAIDKFNSFNSKKRLALYINLQQNQSVLSRHEM